MYYWSHTEVPASVPQTPGRLSGLSWPPPSPCASDIFVSPCSQHEFVPPEKSPRPIFENQDKPRSTAVTPADRNSAFPEFDRSPRCETIPEKTRPEKSPALTPDIPNEASKSSRSSSECPSSPSAHRRIAELETAIKELRQELDKYKTLAEIQTLTANAVRDFGSPTKEKRVDRQIDSSDSKSSSPISTPSQPLPDLISPVENRVSDKSEVQYSRTSPESLKATSPSAKSTTSASSTELKQGTSELPERSESFSSCVPKTSILTTNAELPLRSESFVPKISTDVTSSTVTTSEIGPKPPPLPQESSQPSGKFTLC